MTMPANLFIDAPEVQDVSLTHLSTDTNQWPEEILQKFKERIPRSEGLNLMVKFMKKDDEMGTATGSIVANSNDRAIVVPIIVKDFMLFPIDVMIAKGKLLPLTPDFFSEVFQKGDVFERIEEYPTYGGLGRFEDANLWNAIYPPALGRYAYASAGYPLLDQISGTIKNAHELKEWLEQNPAYAVNFKKHGHQDLIKKLANLRPVNMNEFSQGEENLIPKSVMMVRRENENKYSILSSNDQVFSPAISPVLDYDQCRRFMATITDAVDDAMNEVDQNGEKMLRVPEPSDSVILAKTDEEIAEVADSFDAYSVKSNTGVSVVGLVIPKVIDFDQKPVDLKIFIGKTMQTIQPEICGVRLKNDRMELPGQMPNIGQTGTFVYQPDKSHALATVPVTIKSVSTIGQSLNVVAYDLMGRPYRLRTESTMGLKRIALAHDGTYLMPKEMKWIPMQGFGPVSNSPESYAVKVAGAKITDRPVTIIPTGFGQYSVKGLGKYAAAAGWDPTNLEGHQMRFLLTSLGVSQMKIAQVQKHAARKGHAELHGLRQIPLVSEKVAAARPTAEKLLKISKLLRRNLFKEASYIDNAQTVDAMLALHFVNPDNIAKFIGKIPHLKGAISTLASCLLASRVGLKEVPEEAAATAMHRLVEVVDGLEKLRAAKDIVPS